MDKDTNQVKDVPVIALEHVSKIYYIYKSNRQRFSSVFLGRKRGEVETVLKDIDLRIQAGEKIAVLGDVGSGRSTLINLIAGMTSPTEGTVSVRKETGLIRNLKVGFMNEMSGRQNIRLQGMVFGWTRKEIAEREQAIIEFSGLAGIIDHPVNTYTNTDMNRLGFAIQTSMRPDIILFDAPFTKGDPVFRTKSIQKLQEMCAAGSGTLILVTNDLKLARKICTRAILLDEKKVALDGSVEEVFEHYKKKRKKRGKKAAAVTESQRILREENVNEIDSEEFG